MRRNEPLAMGRGTFLARTCRWTLALLFVHPTGVTRVCLPRVCSMLALAAALAASALAATYDLVVSDNPPWVELKTYGFNQLSASEMQSVAWDFEWTGSVGKDQPPNWSAKSPSGGPHQGLWLKIPMSAFPEPGLYRARARFGSATTPWRGFTVKSQPTPSRVREPIRGESVPPVRRPP